MYTIKINLCKKEKKNEVQKGSRKTARATIKPTKIMKTELSVVN